MNMFKTPNFGVIEERLEINYQAPKMRPKGKGTNRRRGPRLQRTQANNFKHSGDLDNPPIMSPITEPHNSSHHLDEDNDISPALIKRPSTVHPKFGNTKGNFVNLNLSEFSEDWLSVSDRKDNIDQNGAVIYGDDQRPPLISNELRDG